jgi:hypothetical protein
MMKVYRIYGIRHEAVTFAEDPDEAVVRALATGEIGDPFDQLRAGWEAPEAQEIPLPAGYALRPERQSAQWLAFSLENAWAFLHRRLEGLTDAEMFWQPVPDCWTVHQNENGRWLIEQGCVYFAHILAFTLDIGSNDSLEFFAAHLCYSFLAHRLLLNTWLTGQHDRPLSPPETAVYRLTYLLDAAR